MATVALKSVVGRGLSWAYPMASTDMKHPPDMIDIISFTNHFL